MRDDDGDDGDDCLDSEQIGKKHDEMRQAARLFACLV